MRLSRTFAIAALLALGAGALAAQAPTPSARPTRPRMPHRVLNKEDCLSCHARTATRNVKATPAAHEYSNAACPTCHRPAATMPPRSQHAFDAAHTRCQACHVAGNTVSAQVIPENHAGRTNANCVMCHEPQAAGE